MCAPVSVTHVGWSRHLLPAVVAVCSILGCSDPPEVPDVDPPPAGALRLLPLGNSITQASEDQLSYRYALWRRLVDAGASVDFVGSIREHFSGTPDFPQHNGRSFDADHEGHWGWRTDEILAGRGRGGLEDWVADYDADVVLMHLGTNDIFQNQDNASTLAELRQVVGVLRADNPEVTILWAELLPTTDAGTTATIAALNASVRQLAAELNRPESPIRLVDLHTGFDADALTYDGVHPNVAGEEWMAERWYAALQESL